MDNTDLIASQKEVELLRLTYSRLFSTPDGAIVLNDLKKMFYDTPICCSEPIEIAAKAARHDVILGIINLVEDNNEL